MTASTVEGWRPADATERRLTRSRLHAFVRRTSHRAGARECMLMPLAEKVRVQVDGRTGRGHVSGVKRCGSPWACPTCAPKIRQRRASELTELVQRAHACGHVAVLVSFTMPHRAGEPLADVLGFVAAAWRRMWSGRWAVDFKAAHRVVGTVRALEVTYGDNGWHPHWHAVVFLDADDQLVDDQLTALWVAFHRRWSDSVHAVADRRPSARNGVDVELVRDAQAVGDYVADAAGWSIGAELAAGPVKITKSTTSVTPFGLLGAAAVWGETAARDLWLEYEQATAGRHAIQASPGLYALYNVTEAADDDAAAPEAEYVVASVEVDVMAWAALVELHAADRFVMAVEAWAALGASGDPPDARALALAVVDERRRQREARP